MNRTVRFRWWRASVLAACFVTPALSSAQECLLGPVTLPGLPGPPEWDDFNGDGFWRPELHDPRWAGARVNYLQFSPGAAVPANIDDSLVRAVWSGNTLYASYQVEADGNGLSGDDCAYLAFSEGAASGAYALRICLDTTGLVPIGAPPDPGSPGVIVPADPTPPVRVTAFDWWHANDATTAACASNPVTCWGSSQPTPQAPLTAADVAAAIWSRPGGVPRWAVTLKVNLASLAIAGNTRLFFGTRTHINNNAANDLLLGNAAPKDDAAADKVPDTIIPARSDQWVTFQQPGTACTTGVSVSRNDLGVWTGAANSTSGGSLTTSICADASVGSCTTNTEGTRNVFSVTVRNMDNEAGIGAFDIRARFRIATWGSNPAYRNFGPWTSIWPSPAAGVDEFNASNAQLTGSGWHWLSLTDPTPGDNTNDDAFATLHYQCDLNGGAYCPALPPNSDDHQCVMVEIDNRPTSHQKIATKAVYQNMNYVGLSTHTEKATISIEGLKAALGEAVAKDRDVYLYVQKINMPAHGDKPVWLAPEDMNLARQLANNPLPVPVERGAPLPPPGKGEVGKAPIKGKPELAKPLPAKPAAAPAPAAAPVPAKGAAVAVPPAKDRLPPASRLATSKLRFKNGIPVYQTLSMTSEQVLDTVWPTFRVRTYYDSGRTFTAKSNNGKPHRVLVPMVPFGFRLEHDGSLYGFTSALSAIPGVTLTSLGDDWYKLSLKAEGAAQIVTTISAEEKPKSETPCPTCKPCEKCAPPVEKGGHCNCEIPGGPTQGAGWLAAAGALGLVAALRRGRRRYRS